MDMEKQTGDRMKETVLLYGFKDQERLKKVKRALLPLGLRMRTVGPEEYFQPVGYLAGVKEVPPAENDRPGTEFDCRDDGHGRPGVCTGGCGDPRPVPVRGGPYRL